jgi:hypothetical protein
MHVLLIIIILMVAFPAFRRFVGGCLSIILWMILVFLIIAIFLAFFHGSVPPPEEKYTINQERSDGQQSRQIKPLSLPMARQGPPSTFGVG